MQSTTAIMLSSLTGSYPAASLLTNTSSVASSLSIFSSSTCDVTCLVIIAAMTANFYPVDNSTTTVLETVFVSNGTPITTETPTASSQPSYSSSTPITSGFDMCTPSIYENGTVTGCGTELIFTSEYLMVQGVEIFTDCSDSMGTPISDAVEDPDYTGFPFRGITTTGWYWIDAGIDGSPNMQPFFSLLDLPDDCEPIFEGAPYDLMPVAQLTDTQTITSSYQGPKTPTAAAPGSTVTPTTLTPSSTSGGQYYLSTANPTSGTTSQSLSASSSPIQESLSHTTSSLGSLETTTGSATSSEVLSPLLASQSIKISPQLDITVAGSTISPVATGLYLIGSETLAVGGPAITLAGTTISMASSVIVINSQTQNVASASNLPDNPSIVTIGSSIAKTDPSVLYLTDTQTLAPGVPAITTSSITISLATSATTLLINGGTQTIATNLVLYSTGPPLTELPLILDGTTLIANSDSAYVLDTQSLIPGGAAITVSGTTISLLPSDAAIIVDGQTYTADPPLSISTPIPAIATIDGQILSLNSARAYEVGSQTLTPGGPAITVDRTPVSLAKSATVLFINGASQTIATTQTLLPTSPLSTEPPLILGDTTLNANSAGAYLLGTQSFIPGGAAITFSGTTISLLPSDAAIIVDGQTYTADSPSSRSTPIPAIATIDGQILSSNSVGAYEIGSQTVTPGGPAITVDGTPVSLEIVGTRVGLVIGGSTEALTAVGTSSTGGLAEIIISALGGPLPSRTTTKTATGNPLIDTSEAKGCWEIDWRVSAVFVFFALHQLGLHW